MQFNLREVQEQFNKVITYSQDIENPKTNELFADWLEAKRDFIEKMDGRLIYELPGKVSFEMEEKEKTNKIIFFRDYLSNKIQNREFWRFFSMNETGFFSNRVVTPYETSSGDKIPKDMKLLKAFKYFVSDPEILNDIQSEASRIIQKDKIEGKLCISVHPLDYLSLSENTHNWRSCHALDGEYRGGNLSYMVDSSTVICYLKSDRDEVLPNFPEDVKWNSKKWRVLLFFSENWDMMFAGRQYPMELVSGIDYVKDNLLPQIGFSAHWSPWLKEKISHLEEKDVYSYFKSPYVPKGHSLIKMKDLVINKPGSLQFNDLLSSSCYDPVYSYRMRKTFWWKFNDAARYDVDVRDDTKFYIGGKCNCLRCNEEEIELSETMMCFDCELKYGHSESDVFGTCPCCGERFIFDDGWWIESAGETICERCAEEYTCTCGHCYERFYKDRGTYLDEKDLWVCNACLEEEMED